MSRVAPNSGWPSRNVFTRVRQASIDVGAVYCAHVAAALAINVLVNRLGPGVAMTWSDRDRTLALMPGLTLPARVTAGAFDGGQLAWGLVVLAALVLCEGVLAYFPFRVLAPPRRAALHDFLSCWRRIALAGAVLIPVAGTFLVLFPNSPLDHAAPAGLLAFYLLGPTVVHEVRLHRKFRRCRQPSACPECGTGLLRDHAGQCAACAARLPSGWRVSPRWAIRRLAWERRPCPFAPMAYAGTLSRVLLRPWRAARSVTLPDRWTPAVLWAIGHVLAFAAIGVLFASERTFVQLMTQGRVVLAGKNSLAPSAGTIGIWLTHSYVAWALALTAFPVLGGVLAAAAPTWSRSARVTAMKWSLYALPIVAVPLVLCAAARGLTWALSGWHPQASAAPWGRAVSWLAFADPVVLMAFAYAAWWGVGIASNPWLRARGAAMAVVNAAGFMLAWLLATALVFAPGPLGALL